VKIVINRCYGGFGLSERAYLWLIDRGVPVMPYTAQTRDPETGLWSKPKDDGDVIYDYDHPEATLEEPIGGRESFRRLVGRFSMNNGWLERKRNHPLLVACVEALGSEANGRFAKLSIVEIPDDVEWEIDEYDGIEQVHEKHRSWS